MRKTKEIKLTLVATLAIAFAGGCRRTTEVRNCIDDQGRIVPDQKCDSSVPRGGGAGGFGYHYIYGARSGQRIGDMVYGGRAEPSWGSKVVSGETGSIVRGGFGRGGARGGGGE